MRLIPLFLLLCFNLNVRAEQPVENPYATSYTKRVDAAPNKVPVAEVKIFKGQDRDADYLRLLEDGYDLLGTSAFKGGTVPPNQSVAQAKAVNADVVLVYTNRFGKVPDAVKMDAARNRLHKDVTGDGPQEPRMMGNMEYSFEYLATYWNKLPPPALGLHVRDRAESDKSAGVPVVAVIKASPAAAANIRRGDAVLKIGETETNSGDDLVKAVMAQRGKTVQVAWSRDGYVMRTPVTLGAP